VRGAVRIGTPGGQVIKTHLLGLAYQDTQSGTNVLIAEPQDSGAQIVGSNKVFYSFALAGPGQFGADVRYTYNRAGVQQDVILRSQPPSPRRFGFDPNTTDMLVISELAQAPTPSIQERTNVVGRELLRDQIIGFGDMQMVPGRAFDLGSDKRFGVPVAKSFEVVDGRQVIVERVPYYVIEWQLLRLPQDPSTVTNTTDTAAGAALEKAPRWFAKGTLPPGPPSLASSKRFIRKTAELASDKGFVIDWDYVQYGEDTTFYCGSTYVVSGGLNLPSATFQAGAVVKYDYGASLSINGPFYWDGSSGCGDSSILTSLDDDENGDWIYWSSGSPSYGSYGPGLAVYPQYLSTAQAHLTDLYGDPGVIGNLSGVMVSATDPTATKAVSPADKGSFTISRVNGDWSQPLTVTFSVGGTAQTGDYISVGTTATIPAGLGSKVVDIVPTTAASSTFESTVTLAIQVDPNGLYIFGGPSLAKVFLYDPRVAAPAPIPAPSGLVGWWRAEGGSLDSAGGNNGQTSGNVTWIAGYAGQAFSLDGAVNSRLTVNSATALNFGANANFSIEAWIRPIAANTTFGVQAIVDKRDAPNTSSAVGYTIFLNSGRFAAQLSTSPSGWANYGPYGSDLRDGAWHHVAMSVTRNSTQGGKMSVDGQLVGTFDPVTSESGNLSNTQPFRIGNHATANFNGNFKGAIDEVSLYNVALSSTDVANLHNALRGGKCLPPTIVTQPSSQTAVRGGNATFTVSASGSAPLNYQWYHGSSAISGATASSYTKNNVQPPADTGSYYVVVSSCSSSINSANASLGMAMSLAINQIPLGYTIGSPPQSIDSAAQILDPSAGDFSGGNLTVSFTLNGQADDFLSIRNQGLGPQQIGVSGNQVSYQGVTIGTFTGSTPGSPLIITFNSSAATPTAAQALLQNIRFYSFPETVAASTVTRTIQFVLNDGHGQTTPAAFRSISPNLYSSGFLKGINLGGNEQLTVEGNQWLNYPDALSSGLNVLNGGVLSRSFNPVNPPTDGTPTMLQTMVVSNRMPSVTVQRANGVQFTYNRGSGDPEWADRTVTFANFPGGYPIQNNTTYHGWCVNQPLHDQFPGTYDCNVYYSYGPPDPNFPPGTLNMVNYILNNRGTATLPQIQCAIWSVLGTTSVSGCTYNQSLIDAALAHPDFVPGPGQIVGAIVEPLNSSTMLQPILVEIPGSDPHSVDLKLTQSIASGSYSVYVWLAESEANNTRSLDVKVQGATAQSGVGNLQLNQWSKLGPYSATVGTDKQLVVEVISPVKGDPILMGMAIFGPPISGNHPPTLTTIQTLKRTRQNTTFPISYDTLLAASDAADPDNNAVSFKIVAISSGTLTKAGALVTAGTTLLGPGESVEWTPPSNQNGPAMSAFTVVAQDTGGLQSSPAVQAKVEVDPANTPPLVNAGADIQLTAPGPVTLAGSVSDAEQSGSQLTIWWNRVSGPGDVSFSDVHSPTATATFTAEGDYVLRLSAFDGEFTVSDEVNVSTCIGQRAPLDVVVMLDISGSVTGNADNFALAQQSVRQLVSRLNLNNSANSDKVAFVPIGNKNPTPIPGDPRPPPPPFCESMSLTSDPAIINGYVDGYYGFALEWEDFEPPIRTAIAYLKQDLATRNARPVVVFISDFAIWRYEDETYDEYGTILGNLVAKMSGDGVLPGEGVRLISLGFNLDVIYPPPPPPQPPLRYLPTDMWALLSSSASDRFEATDIKNLPDVAGSITIKGCQTSGNGICAFAYDDKTVQYTPSPVSFSVKGERKDFRGVTVPPTSIQWTSSDHPTHVQFSDPTIANPTVTISSPVNGDDYVLDFAVNLGSSQAAHDSITIHLGDVANQAPIARCDVFQIQENSVTNRLNVLTNDIDPNGDELFIQSVQPILNGTIYVSDDRKALIYTPDPGFFTPIPWGSTDPDPNYIQLYGMISYTVSDHSDPTAPDALTTTADIQITVHPVTVPPIALPDTFVVSTGDNPDEFFDVLGNDVNPNTQDTNPTDKGLNIVNLSKPTGIGSATHPGNVRIDPSKKFLLYTVDTGASQGDQITFNYTIEDIHGSRATATVTVVIDNNSDVHPPMPVGDYRVVFSDTIPTISVLDNDSDPDPYDAGRLTVTSLSAVKLPNNPNPPANSWQNYFPGVSDSLVFHPHQLPGDTAPAVLGTYVFQYQVTDSQGLPATANLTISLQDRGPNPIAVDDPGYNDPVYSVAMNNADGIVIPVVNNDKGVGLTVRLNPDPLNLPHGTATVPLLGPNVGKVVYVPNGTYGLETFPYTITDPGNRSASAKVTVAVYNPSSTATVTGHLAHNPDLTPGDPALLGVAGCDEQIETVREGVIEVRGDANDTDSNDAFSYDLKLYDSATPSPVLATSHGTSPVPVPAPGQLAGLLGTLDARNLPNGRYRIELTVHGGNKTATAQKDVQIQSSYKIGVLRFSEADATVTLGGTPISATRSYDSVNANARKQGDFGPGWTFALDDLQVEINETREMVTAHSLGAPFSRRSGGGRDISLTLPNGQRATFAFNPQGNGLGQITARWKCVTPGVPATTTLTSDPEDNEYMVSLFGLMCWSRNPDTTPGRYDLSRFLLKLTDGTLIHIARDFLGAHNYTDPEDGFSDYFVQTYGTPRVTEIETPNHEHYFFRHDGAQGFGNVDSVDHQFPRQSAATAALRIVRDPKTKLITAIHDRNTLDSSGNPLPNSAPAVIYEYDSGQTPDDPLRLARIRRLRSATTSANPVYDTTTNLYENVNFPYLVTSIIGPRGVLVAKTTYDNLGRISRIDRPDGRWLEYHHDDPPITPGATARERIVDSEEREIIQETDGRGNILLAIDALGNQTSRTFDADDNALLGEIVRDPFANIVSQVQHTYARHPSGQIKRHLAVQGIDQTIGSKTVEEYDDRGHLTRTIDANNTTITDVNSTPTPIFAYTYTYNTSGQPTFSQCVNNGVTTTLSRQTYYDDFTPPFSGMLHETFDAVGTRTIHDYYDGSTTAGRFGDLKAVTTVDAAYNQLSQTIYEYDAKGNRTKEIRYARPVGNNTWSPYSTAIYTYDTQGRLLDTADPYGGHSTTVYDSEGRTLSSRDRFGFTTTYAHDVLGDLVQTTFPDNTYSRSATYYADENGHLLRHVIREDRHLTAGPVNGSLTIYDENNRPIATDKVKNVLIGFSDDGTTRKTTYISSQRINNGSGVSPHDSQTKYDAAGRVSLSADALSRWTRYDYDNQGRHWRTKSFVNADGNDTPDTIVTQTGFDANGNTLWTLDPNQYEHVKSAIENMTPDQVSAYLWANERGRLTQFTYDVFNRVIQTDLPAETGAATASTKSNYDVAGRSWLEVDADNHAKAFVYDGAGRLSWVVTDFNPASIGIPGNLPSDLFSYTWADRQADSTLTHYEYDDLGRMLKQTDGNQHATTFEYDLLDRRTKRTLPGNQSEAWAYDYGSPFPGDKINKIRHHDFNNRYILTTFDSSGRVSSRTPDGQDAGVTPLLAAATRAVSFAYTPSGQRASMQEGNSVLVSGQLERHTYYVYDEFDHLRINAAPEGTFSYTYDPAGKIMTIDARRAYSTPTDPVYHDSSLEQQLPGVPLSHDAGALNYYFYDGRNRLADASGGPFTGAPSVSYLYDPSGNLTSYGHGFIFISTYQYNWRNQLRYLKTQSYDSSPSSPIIASFDYDAYDTATCPIWASASERRLKPSGMRQGLAEIIAYNNHEYRRVLAYDNDALGRLRAERIRTATDAWPAAFPPAALPSSPATGDVLYDVTAGYGDSTGYDKVGNRRSRNSASSGVSTASYAAYDGDDRLGSTLATGTAASTFDANGNTLQFNLDGNNTWDQSATDQYDFENHLIAATRGSANISIVYDGDGNRVSKTVGSTTTRYLVDDQNPTGYAQVLEEQDNLGAPLVTYIYGSGSAPVSQTRSGDTRYYGCDGQGTVRFLMDDIVNNVDHITDTYTYDAFGILTGSASRSTPTPNSYLYTGEQFDSDLGLYYLRARYYNPIEGRFWTMDSFEGHETDPMSLHKYAYCASEPINKADPSGHDITEVLTMMDGFGNFMAPLISAFPRGGPDVTAVLARTLNEVNAFYDDLSPRKKNESEEALRATIGSLFSGIWGKSWEIHDVRAISPQNNILTMGSGVGKHDYKCGEGQFAGTLAVDHKCFYAHAVNYAIWGRMWRVIHDKAERVGYGAGSWTLAEAKSHVRGFKALPPNLDIGNENMREAVWMTEYGWTGKLPAEAKGLLCVPVGEVTEGVSFQWKWLPYHDE